MIWKWEEVGLKSRGVIETPTGLLRKQRPRIVVDSTFFLCMQPRFPVESLDHFHADRYISGLAKLIFR